MNQKRAPLPDCDINARCFAFVGQPERVFFGENRAFRGVFEPRRFQYMHAVAERYEGKRISDGNIKQNGGFRIINIRMIPANHGADAKIVSNLQKMQVIKKIVPPMSNEIITLVKDTSLARVIAVSEVIMMADRFTARGLIWPLFYTGVFFLLFNGILTVIFGRIEKKLDYYRS